MQSEDTNDNYNLNIASKAKAQADIPLALLHLLRKGNSLHNQVNIRHLAEVTDSLTVVAVSHDYVLAGHILCKFFYSAGVGEHFQAGQLGSRIVPAKLIPCGGILCLAGVDMHLVPALQIHQTAAIHIAGFCFGYNQLFT